MERFDAIEVLTLNRDLGKGHRVPKSLLVNCLPILIRCRILWHVYIFKIFFILLICILCSAIIYKDLGNARGCGEPDIESMRRVSNGDFSGEWTVIRCKNEILFLSLSSKSHYNLSAIPNVID